MYDIALIQQQYLRVLSDFWLVVNGIEVDIDPCAPEKHVPVKFIFFFSKPLTHCSSQWGEQPHAFLDIYST